MSLRINITTYLAWDENGCRTSYYNPLSYKEYLEAIESGDWYGYQNGDCSDIPDVVTIIVAEEEEIEADETEKDLDIDPGENEQTDEIEELTDEEIQAIEAEIRAEEERLIQEQLDAEEEAEIVIRVRRNSDCCRRFV